MLEMSCCLVVQHADPDYSISQAACAEEGTVKHVLRCGCLFHPTTQVLRLANNSLTGGIPSSATTAASLFMLDLHSNKLAGSIPENWAAPALQMLMLEDNHLTGGRVGWWVGGRGARARGQGCTTSQRLEVALPPAPNQH